MLSNVVILLLLGLINLGSTTAFNALISVVLIGQYSTYVMPIVLILVRRISNTKNIPFGPWNLGIFGIPINVLSIAFSFLTITFNLLPPYMPVTSANLNYAGVIFGVMLIVSAVLWIFRGKRHYAGPIREVMENGNIRSALLDREAGAAHSHEIDFAAKTEAVSPRSDTAV